MIVMCSFFLLVSGYWIIEGFLKYGFMSNGLPSVGFFPILAGFLVFILSLFSLVMAIRKQLANRTETQPEETNQDADNSENMISFVPQKWIPLFVLAYSVVLILFFLYVGTITSVFITCFSWLFIIFRRPLWKSLLFSVCVALVVYFVFVLWLNTPFPKGFLF